MAQIFGIGTAALDIINTVDGYPQEDGEVRAIRQRICRGGNAANTLVVLSQLGHACAWAGVLADGPDGARILDDLARYRIDTRACRIEPRGKVPTSYIIVNQRNGSRTIVHYRELREFSYEDFRALDLSAYDWLHFEGRNVQDTERMLRRVKSEQTTIRVSLELEKPRERIERLLPYADLLLVSRAYASHQGFVEPRAFLEYMRERAPEAEMACAWGEEGGWGLDRDGSAYFSPAWSPARVVDTLGAGDTFNAGVIDARVRGESLQAALSAGCRLAGRKCGQEGLAGLGPGCGGSTPEAEKE
jgi:ketohexokinase